MTRKKLLHLVIALIPLLVIATILLEIYLPWFRHPEIIGGDWPMYYREFLAEQKIFPSLWSAYRGLGGAVTPLLNLETFQAFLIVPWVNWLGLPWSLVYKVGWFGLFLILSFFSPVVLWRSVFLRIPLRWPAFFAGLIYSSNTYILMVTAGGQMGVALSYSLAPIVLASFIKLLRSFSFSDQNVKCQMSNVKCLLMAGLALGIQLMIDPRIAYVTMIAVAIYFVVFRTYARFPESKLPRFRESNSAVDGARKSWLQRALTIFLLVFTIPLGISALLNAFWLLPTAATASRTVSELGATYTSSSAVSFFSFADFSHALSLLHPNWPENLFGKTYFLRPEFIVLPIFAFASLLFIGQETVIVRFFALLALFGAFLAKGAIEPLGGVYIWLFEKFPGFVMFRDPTKWYVLIAISYSVLIPSAIQQCIEFLSSQKLGASSKGKNILFHTTNYLLPATFLLFWFFTIREATLGKLGGTFTKRNVPQEYVELANYISRQPDFFRILWVPKQPRFSPVSDLHPSFSSEFINSASNFAGFVARFDNPDIQGHLEELAVKYIVIPYDALGEIFLDDRHYDPKERTEWERYLDTIIWLKKLSSGSITVYETSRRNDHFWVSDGKISDYRMLSPGRYEVTLATQSPAILYFSEGFNPGWRVRLGIQIIASKKTPSGLNSFVIPWGFMGDIQVFFYPDVYAKWGRIVSIVTLAGIAIFVILQSQRRRRSL